MVNWICGSMELLGCRNCWLCSACWIMKVSSMYQSQSLGGLGEVLMASDDLGFKLLYEQIGN